MSGAQAYSQMYLERFETNRMNTKIRLIMDKLGIEAPDYSQKNNGGSGSNNRSFFNGLGSSRNAGNAIPSENGMRSTTMDALADDME